ncbi:unnamed protein product [Amoebophrya sp. A120]|nr:unnamed protein product [Amoebophrya sp. A120]|eukprot:GSA120T00008965001.1
MAKTPAQGQAEKSMVVEADVNPDTFPFLHKGEVGDDKNGIYGHMIRSPGKITEQLWSYGAKMVAAAKGRAPDMQGYNHFAKGMSAAVLPYVKQHKMSISEILDQFHEVFLATAPNAAEITKVLMDLFLELKEEDPSLVLKTTDLLPHLRSEHLVKIAAASKKKLEFETVLDSVVTMASGKGDRFEIMEKVNVAFNNSHKFMRINFDTLKEQLNTIPAADRLKLSYYTAFYENCKRFRVVPTNFFYKKYVLRDTEVELPVDDHGIDCLKNLISKMTKWDTSLSNSGSSFDVFTFAKKMERAHNSLQDDIDHANAELQKKNDFLYALLESADVQAVEDMWTEGGDYDETRKEFLDFVKSNDYSDMRSQFQYGMDGSPIKNYINNMIKDSETLKTEEEAKAALQLLQKMKDQDTLDNSNDMVKKTISDLKRMHFLLPAAERAKFQALDEHCAATAAEKALEARRRKGRGKLGAL